MIARLRSLMGMEVSKRADSPTSVESMPSVVGSSSSDGSDVSSVEGSSAVMNTPRKIIMSSPPPTPISSFIHGRDSPPLEEHDVVGISKPSYQVNEEFVDNVPPTKEAATRIGISPSKYERPDFPESPENLFLIHKAKMMEQRQQEYASPSATNIYLVADSSPPRNKWSSMPPVEEEEVNDGVERLVHEPTASGHFLVSSSPQMSHPEGLRFNLTKGKAEIRKDDAKLVSGLPTLEVSSPHASSCGSSVASSVTTLSSSVASSVQSCATPYKIFCLLLHPVAKIFELIQIIYSPDVTTVGDLLHLIPENASEAALGLQDYVGLCRPKDNQRSLCDVDAMASSGEHGEESAGIKCGEILVPIPYGYDAAQTSPMSRAILKNPQILSLLQKSNPLSPSKSADPFEMHSTSSKMFLTSLEDIREEDEEAVRRESRRRRKKKRRSKLGKKSMVDDTIPETAGDMVDPTTPSPADPVETEQPFDINIVPIEEEPVASFDEDPVPSSEEEPNSSFDTVSRSEDERNSSFDTVPEGEPNSSFDTVSSSEQDKKTGWTTKNRRKRRIKKVLSVLKPRRFGQSIKPKEHA